MKIFAETMNGRAGASRWRATAAARRSREGRPGHGLSPSAERSKGKGTQGPLASPWFKHVWIPFPRLRRAGDDKARATANALAVAAVFALAAQSAAQDLRPPRAFLAPDLAAQQDDPSRHPGWLWVDQGEALWARAPASGKPSCQGCHGDIAAMRGVATRYPAVAADGRLDNLETRIERCRTENQGERPFGWESEALLSLTTAIAQRSRGLPISVRVDGPAAPFLEEGRRLYATRQGQLNLSCGQCHDENAGKRLRGDVISNGLGTGFPAYRLEWNTLGSLHRRLRACSLGVRATQFDLGSPEYLALELFLADRARGLPVETPGLRR